MSTLSALSNHLEQEASVLRELNEATLCIQAAALGDLEILGITNESVKKASLILRRFLNNLRQALETESLDPLVAMLVENIKSGPKPVEDWISDIEKLLDALGQDIFQDEITLYAIEDILTLLTDDYSIGVQALYHR